MPMTTLSIILIIIFITQGILWTGYAKLTAGKRYDNNHPRDFLSTLEGASRRAYAAHQNSNEALPIFLAALICANISNVNPNLIHALAFGALITRLLYGICYIKDKSNLRSSVWGLSLLFKAGLFIACIF